MNKYSCYECGTITTITKLRDAGACPRCGDTNFTVTYSERFIVMPNIKITAEIDGKQVPLDNISTETFEAIKALEKPKEIPIPVARWATSRYAGGPRLLLKPSKNLHLYSEYIYAIDIKNGTIAVTWKPEEDENRVSSNYMNVQPL